MTEFDKLSKELTSELKKLSKVQEGPNAAVEYLKFLKKTLEKAQTFDSENPDTFVNYVTGEKPKSAKKTGGGGGGDEPKKSKVVMGSIEKAKVKKAVKPK